MLSKGGGVRHVLTGSRLFAFMGTSGGWGFGKLGKTLFLSLTSAKVAVYPELEESTNAGFAEEGSCWEGAEVPCCEEIGTESWKIFVYPEPSTSP